MGGVWAIQQWRDFFGVVPVQHGEHPQRIKRQGSRVAQYGQIAKNFRKIFFKPKSSVLKEIFKIINARINGTTHSLTRISFLFIKQEFCVRSLSNRFTKNKANQKNLVYNKSLSRSSWPYKCKNSMRKAALKKASSRILTLKN